MKRAIALLSGGLAIAVVTGAGTAAAPGTAAPPPVALSGDCASDPGVTVAWSLADDITLVRAVEIGNLPEECRRQKIRVSLRNDEGELLARATQRENPAAATVSVALDPAVEAAEVARVELVIAGSPANDHGDSW